MKLPVQKLTGFPQFAYFNVDDFDFAHFPRSQCLMDDDRRQSLEQICNKQYNTIKVEEIIKGIFLVGITCKVAAEVLGDVRYLDQSSFADRFQVLGFGDTLVIDEIVVFLRISKKTLGPIDVVLILGRIRHFLLSTFQQINGILHSNKYSIIINFKDLTQQSASSLR